MTRGPARPDHLGMGSKTSGEVTGDLVGGPATETVRFGVDGQDFEIILSRANAAALRTALQPYVDAGRRVDDRRISLVRAATRVDDAAVRAWAAGIGVKLSARGRLPTYVIEQYQAAGN